MLARKSRGLNGRNTVSRQNGMQKRLEPKIEREQEKEEVRAVMRSREATNGRVSGGGIGIHYT